MDHNIYLPSTTASERRSRKHNSTTTAASATTTRITVRNGVGGGTMPTSPTKRTPLVRSKSAYLSPNGALRNGDGDGGGGGGGVNRLFAPPSPVHKYGMHFAVASEKRRSGGGGGEGQSSVHATPHIIAMVGLPARGKTYISKKLNRYLNWIGVDTEVVNLGDYRRKKSTYHDHSIFNPNNEEGLRIRNQVCEQGLQDAFDFIERDGVEVVVFDATNTTRQRRELLRRRVVDEKGFKLFFVESVCDDERIIENNIRSVKVNSPDYVGFTADTVVEDFKKRIQHYADQYETLNEALEPGLSFIKIFNAGEKVLVHKHEGHIQSRVVYYLMNINLRPRTIYLTRHGESQNNVEGRIGGDASLTERGKAYSVALAKRINDMEMEGLLIWTSCMKRTLQTSKFVEGTHEKWKTLNELDVGTCDSLTYSEIRERFPAEFRARDLDKYSYRYPMGESYADLVARLEPVIMELERQTTVLVVAHQAVLRCILAYFEEVDEAELPYLEVPLHTLFTLVPKAYGCDVHEEPLDVECVSTHRPKPDKAGTLGESYIESLPPPTNGEGNGENEDGGKMRRSCTTSCFPDT